VVLVVVVVVVVLVVLVLEVVVLEVVVVVVVVMVLVVLVVFQCSRFAVFPFCPKTGEQTHTIPRLCRPAAASRET